MARRRAKVWKSPYGYWVAKLSGQPLGTAFGSHAAAIDWATRQLMNHAVDTRQAWERANERRTALAVQRTVTHTVAGKRRSQSERQRELLIRRDGPLCHYCGIELTALTGTRDHIVPVSMKGPSKLDNYVLACHRCNAAKGSERGACTCTRCHTAWAQWGPVKVHAMRLTPSNQAPRVPTAKRQCWHALCPHTHCLKAETRAGRP